MVEWQWRGRFCPISGLRAGLLQFAPSVAHRIGSSICSRKQGIVSQVRVPGGLRDIGMAECSTDDEQGVTRIHKITGERMPEIMNADVLQPSPSTRGMPRFVNIDQRLKGLGVRQDVGAVFPAWQFLKQLNGSDRERNVTRFARL